VLLCPDTQQMRACLVLSLSWDERRQHRRRQRLEESLERLFLAERLSIYVCFPSPLIQKMNWPSGLAGEWPESGFPKVSSFHSGPY
jgi:hypothetical protein